MYLIIYDMTFYEKAIYTPVKRIIIILYDRTNKMICLPLDNNIMTISDDNIKFV